MGAHARAFGTVALALAVSMPLTGTPVAADSSHRAPHRAYQPRLLVTNQPTSSPAIQDTDLTNPWGIAFGYGKNATPLWVANNGSATSTLYTGANASTSQVAKVALTVTTPPEPTGLVINNNASAFKLPTGLSAKFIFATEGGLIAGWSAPPPLTTTMTTMVTQPGAVFTGLAIARTAKGPRLYAADGAHGVVRVYNSAFKQVNTFRDKHAPKNLVPYNVTTIGHRVFVSYAAPEGVEAKVPGAVDVFKFGGHLTHRLIVGHRLDGPWGMVVAPGNWGKFGGDLLVGNEEGGAIHAYNRHSGALQGTVRKLNGKAIKYDGLWGMQFGNGVIGTPRTLIVVAGIDDYVDGVVVAIRPVRGGSGGGYTQRPM